jgi:hypothetical protein
MKRRAFLMLIPLAAGLGGCSKLKRLTGQTNNTVLPGEREDILPPDQHTAKKEDAAGEPGLDPGSEPLEQAPPSATKTGSKPKTGGVCNPEVDPDCAPADAGGNDGIFSDG